MKKYFAVLGMSMLVVAVMVAFFQFVYTLLWGVEPSEAQTASVL